MRPPEVALAIARASPCEFGDFLACSDFCEQLIRKEREKVDDGERSMEKQGTKGLKINQDETDLCKMTI